MTNLRIGYGYDVHRLMAEHKLILGGVPIPFSMGLTGHSDADVLIHAIIDALLGAAALGDIGQHFPDADPAYEGISSVILLQSVGRLLRNAGYSIVNIDATVLAQAPQLAPYVEEIRRRIAGTLGLDISAVSVKATTEEGLGFTGESKGIATHAVALIERTDGHNL